MSKESITETEHEPQVLALAEYLDADPDDILETGCNTYADSCDQYGPEYHVLDDDGADEAVAESIKNSLWTFNASFLAGETGFDKDIFTCMQDKCEDANSAFLSLIEQSCGLTSFIESAVGCNGRGHFLSSYDGNENESGDYFIYRIN